MWSKRSLRLAVCLLPSCAELSLAAPVALGGTVKIEFSARVRAGEECSPQRDSSLAKQVAAPGTTITGEVEYNSEASVSPESDPDVANYYYFGTSEFHVSLAIGERLVFRSFSNGTARISSGLLGRRPGEPKIGFSADARSGLEAWPGQIDRLVFQLVLRVSDDAPRLTHLPSSIEINALPLSSLSRVDLIGEQSRDPGFRTRPTLWMLCSDVISLVASEEPAK